MKNLSNEDLRALKGMGLHNLAGLTERPRFLRRIQCYFGLHKWKKCRVTTARPTTKNKGLWISQSLYVCEFCNELKGPVKQESCFEFLRQNKEET